jgi:hypothetical protein
VAGAEDLSGQSQFGLESAQISRTDDALAWAIGVEIAVATTSSAPRDVEVEGEGFLTA